MAFEEGEPQPLDLGGVEVVFLVVFALVGLLVLAGFVFVGYGMVRSARAARQAGIDPFTSEAQVVSQALSGPALTLEQRLVQLDDLHRRGVISAEEHRTARAKVLAGS